MLVFRACVVTSRDMMVSAQGAKLWTKSMFPLENAFLKIRFP